MARPRTFDVDDVVAAARDEFWNRGYTATSIDDLTAATGLGKGSLYGAFGDKHRLYLRALDDYIATSLAGVRETLRDPRYGARERLVRHLRGQMKAIAADADRRGCMIAKGAAELAAADNDVEQKVAQAYAMWRDELVSPAGRNGLRGATRPCAGGGSAGVHARPGGAAQRRCDGGSAEGRRRGDGLPDPHRRRRPRGSTKPETTAQIVGFVERERGEVLADPLPVPPHTL
jgi:AcrR family transcriptional regulator